MLIYTSMSLLQTVRNIAPYLESWLEYQRDWALIPGVQVAIRVEGELAASFALGLANEETGEQLTTQHLFRIASHSKTFTATAIFQLIEAGKLRLDDTAVHWIPELEGSPAAQYSVRELLGHQTGINRDGADSDYWQQKFNFPDKEALLELCRAKEVFAPNQHFKYSNMGYSLLGLIIEAASKMSYADYVDQHIVGPLKLNDLGAELPAERLKELATGHSKCLSSQDTRRTMSSCDTQAMAAATGFYGTAEDTSAYLTEHTFGREALISDSSKRLMQRKESEIKHPAQQWYGLGLMIADLGGRTVIGHSGGFPGHITKSWLDPQTGLSVSVLTNSLDGPAGLWATNIIHLIDLAHKTPDQESEDAANTKEITLDTFTGRFATSWGIFDIVDLNGRLVSIFPQGNPKMSATELSIDDANTLQPDAQAGFSAVGEAFTFQRDQQGQIESMRYGGATCLPYAKFREQEGLPKLNSTLLTSWTE